MSPQKVVYVTTQCLHNVAHVITKCLRHHKMLLTSPQNLAHVITQCRARQHKMLTESFHRPTRRRAGQKKTQRLAVSSGHFINQPVLTSVRDQAVQEVALPTPREVGDLWTHIILRLNREDF